MLKNLINDFFSKSAKHFSNSGQTLDSSEINQFEQVADGWWDEQGPFKILHKINPIRLSFIKEIVRDQLLSSLSEPLMTAKPFKDLKILDIGCGGGLLCEPFTRLGAHVTGIDASKTGIKIAKEHATNMGLNIDYRTSTVEDLQEPPFDVVCALEIVEHVQDVDLFLDHCMRLVKPNGLLILSTFNQTIKSYALGIVAAEKILRWVPAGTHSWDKFIKPADLASILRKKQFEMVELKGISLNLLSNQWQLSDDLDINYIACFKRPE